MVRLLAANYILSDDPPKGKICRNVKAAIAAFERNNRTALDAGLIGHGSILSSVATLITLLNRPAALSRHSVALDGNISLTSSVVVEDPFRNLALFSLRDLLSELLDVGDCQHFVVCYEILRRNGLLEGICETPLNGANGPPGSPTAVSGRSLGGAGEKGVSMLAETVKKDYDLIKPSMKLGELRIREAYLAYIDILSRLGLFTAANELINASTDPYISELSKKGIRLKVGCARCGKEVAADQTSGGSGGSTAITSLFCPKCKCSSGKCVVCQMPVLGLYQWCPVCSHGGHRHCIDAWFRSRSEDCMNKRRDRVSLFKRHLIIPDDKGKRGNLNQSLHFGAISCPSGCGHRCFVSTSPRCAEDHRQPQNREDDFNELTETQYGGQPISDEK